MSQDATIQTPAPEPTSPKQSTSRWKPLRIWPPVLLMLAIIPCRLLPSLVEDGGPMIWMVPAFGPALCGLLIMLWWLVASRATIAERFVGILGVIIAAAATFALIDKSMFGPAVLVLVIPAGTLAFGVGAILCHRMLSFRRTIIAVLLACIGFGSTTLLRSDGLWGNFALGLHFRWAPSSEDVVLRQESKPRSADVASDALTEAIAHPEWPAFRGPNRDGEEQGSAVATDWSATPPKQLWKIPVGPGWSSFAVAGPVLFTQEQRGAFETIVCYATDSGQTVWTRQVESRFEDPLGGPGPRATPTIADGALYAFGAKGILLKLNPVTGDILWQQDIKKVADREPPIWGFSSSPLVVNDVVVVHAGGKGDKGVLAFNVSDGDLAWSAGSGDHSYSSPQLSTVAGEQVILMETNTGLNILDPASGKSRLDYDWKFENYRACQPQVIDGDSILLETPATGTRRIRISQSDDQWKADEVWTTRNLKPEFNDLVIYQGHAYGFDSGIFTCIDLVTGNRKWKGGRYGKGQVLLVKDCGLLLIAGEQGELVLVKADPKQSTELGRIQALEGKTWNHPVLIGDRLYHRNSQEAACYRLPLANAAVSTIGQ